MDSANKQDAIVAEVTPGTTPSSPSFLLLRSTNISRSATRPRTRSPERRADRRASTMVAGNNTYSLTIVTPFVRDAATDVLWASLLNSSFSTNVMKDGSTATYFTLEEKYEAGATDPYHRHLGCRVTSLSIDFRLGEGGTMTWTILALSQTQATSAIASSTYAAPSPNVAPVSTPEIAVSGLLGLSSPGVTGLRMMINNNMQPLHKFGSAEPTALSLGLFDVSGQVDVYFSAAADYTSMIPYLAGSTISLVFGSSSGNKDQFDMLEVDGFDPIVGDPGPTGVHIESISFMARHDASDGSAFKLTRNVS